MTVPQCTALSRNGYHSIPSSASNNDITHPINTNKTWSTYLPTHNVYQAIIQSLLNTKIIDLCIQKIVNTGNANQTDQNATTHLKELCSHFSLWALQATEEGWLQFSGEL